MLKRSKQLCTCDPNNYLTNQLVDSNLNNRLIVFVIIKQILSNVVLREIIQQYSC